MKMLRDAVERLRGKPHQTQADKRRERAIQYLNDHEPLSADDMVAALEICSGKRNY